MEGLWSIVVGVFVAAGIYLMLERHLLRLLFGLILLSSAVNLAIFTAGRLTPASPPLIEVGALLPAEGAANPLPQALILTAIVIGFGLLVFALMLFYRAYFETGSADVDEMRRSEEEE
ncbi:TPA: Na+/H+ antiporter subunit C [Vibrio cholerae]|uniref:Na+/H+ antiporter subunit C n=1 Tax=Vibrio TaxID=662 RepID=UPI00052CD8B8|nr:MULTISPECIES: Na+/H+ antiporter subunit C [Vibrio]EII2376241.1 Na+/H+ antiporter subunit C [Vibrio cholerae]EJL6913547.1 Na+/H+ antiporter subunit C [Vibrio cholerae]EJL8267445.1 Na+/H+ antiporter subunit C [Vibrio cholerae]EJY4339916.1 Na+/H+ antiporter subunit C [Vibrio cholerae]EKF9746672.1 Na+/H+ antiporter subunit C [Vibrio cholerae]